MSKGLGARQRDILAKLAQHRDYPADYNGFWFIHRKTGRWTYGEHPKHRHDRYPEWMTVRELAGLTLNETHCHRASDIESTRRAVRTLEAAGLVETKKIWRGDHGQAQIGVRLPMTDTIC
jgi:hypothetical protein